MEYFVNLNEEIVHECEEVFSDAVNTVCTYEVEDVSKHGKKCSDGSLKESLNLIDDRFKDGFEITVICCVSNVICFCGSYCAESLKERNNSEVVASATNDSDLSNTVCIIFVRNYDKLVANKEKCKYGIKRSCEVTDEVN